MGMQHAGFRFAAIAAIVLRMRAKENGIDFCTYRLCGCMHFLMYGIQCHDVEHAARDAGLIGGDDDAVVGLIQAGNRFQRTGYRLPLIRCFDEGVRVLIDDAIAIKNNQFHRITFQNGLHDFSSIRYCNGMKQAVRFNQEASLEISAT